MQIHFNFFSFFLHLSVLDQLRLLLTQGCVKMSYFAFIYIIYIENMYIFSISYFAMYKYYVIIQI